jgi:hypothetical protein
VNTVQTIIAFIGSTGILGIAGRYALSAINSGITDLQANISKHLTPNGGSSAYDQIVKAQETAEEALKVANANTEALKALSDKLDSIVLSSVS